MSICMVSVSTMEIDQKKLLEKAIVNLRDTVQVALEHTDDHRALVIYDTHNELTKLLAEAYRVVLPQAQFVDFDTHTKESILALCDSLAPRDLVILVQSTDFRLNEFRIRIHLFQRKLKVIDHQHVSRHMPETWETYVNALAYDSTWYRPTGRALKQRLLTLETLTVTADVHTLTVHGGLEEPKLNIGDYTGMENIGGTFPIGEVFTEAKVLEQVSGSVLVYAFGNPDFTVAHYEPFRVDISEGVVVSWSENTPQAFIDVVEKIQTNERAILREIGFGLNRSITREHYLRDITAFERNFGLHVSLGEKHTVYKKQGIVADKTRYHVDLFVCADTIAADGAPIFTNGAYLLT